MLLFDDKVSQTVAIEIDPQNGDCLEGMRLHSIQPNQRHSEWIRGRQERLKKISNGRTITTMMESKCSRDWLWLNRGLIRSDAIKHFHLPFLQR